LYLSNNKITENPDNLPQSLRWLDLENNHITEIPDNLPQGLRWLDLRINNITEIPDTLPQGLQTLYLSNNKITEGYRTTGFYCYDDNVYLFNNQIEYSKFYQMRLKHKTKQIIKIQKWWKKFFYKKHLDYCKEKLQEPLISNLIFKFL